MGELAFGAEKSSRSSQAQEALEEFLVALEVAGFDEASAMTYGKVRTSLERQRKPIGPLDTLIGSHALEIDGGRGLDDASAHYEI